MKKLLSQKDVGSCLEFVMSQDNVRKVEITKGEITVFYYSDFEKEVVHSHFGFGSHLENSKDEPWKIGLEKAAQFFSVEPE